MRTFEEIKASVDDASAMNNAEVLLGDAIELDSISTPEATALAAFARGVAMVYRSNYAEALEYYHRALALYDELGNSSGVARVTTGIGIVHSSTGNYPAALEHFHRALAMYEELGNHKGVANVTGNIGIVHLSIGNYPAALEHYHRALAANEELGNRSGAAYNTGNIGIVHVSTGNYPVALEHLHRALAIHEELGNRYGVAGTTNDIGAVHFKTGNYPAALEHFHRALAVNEELGNRSWAANNTSNIGNVHRNTGNYPAALEHLHRALAMHEELGDSSGVAHDTSGILTAMIAAELYDEAEALLQTMDGMKIDAPTVIVQRELCRAWLQEHHGSIDEAKVTLRAALLIAQEHILAREQADLHIELRELALKRNDLAGYVEHNNEYTRITEEIDGKDTATKLAMQEKQREIVAERKEIDKQLAVLHSTLPKHIADRVARGEVVNDHFENASVIFLDIVGFTSISDRIPSGHVVHLLEQIFTTLDAVCEKHNVVKIKTIGDSYMAVLFESVVNAATCALEMMSALDTLEITMPPSLGDTSWTKDVSDIKVRIGMHCGPVTAGVIGTARMQYDVWGDTVNVASRMESSGEPGRIHVSEAFASRIRGNGEGVDPGLRRGDENSRHPREGGDSLTLVERGVIDIKGKGPMTTYWLG